MIIVNEFTNPIISSCSDYVNSSYYLIGFIIKISYLWQNIKFFYHKKKHFYNFICVLLLLFEKSTEKHTFLIVIQCKVR